jgi:hypothetical protein
LSRDAASRDDPVPGRPYSTSGESLIEVALPPGSPLETQIAVRRLVELTGILARRCAQLQQALTTRIVIEQAKGILSERLDIDPEQAFVLLRNAARSNRMRLRDLAQNVVSSLDTPPELRAAGKRQRS